MIRSDDPHFAGTNFPVDPENEAEEKEYGEERATQDTPVSLSLFMQLSVNPTGTMPGQSWQWQ